MLVDDREFTQSVGRIEALLDEIESFPDPDLRARTAEIVQSLLMLYGEGLARTLSLMEEKVGPETGADILEALAADEVVSHLLLLHDLHPVDVQTRVTRALDEVRPYLKSHGGNVELLGVEDGIARLRLQGSCSGCPSSTMTLKLAIEEALLRSAPDLEGIEAEGVAEPPSRPVSFLPASDILSLKERQKPAPAPGWVTAQGLGADALAAGDVRALDVSGVSLLFLDSGGDLYAYRNGCPECGNALTDGVLDGSELACPACGRRYDVRQAGRGVEPSGQSLEPVPLLVRNGEVKVALSGAQDSG